ncbi:MAG TPA: hypothetical protein VN699_17860 [Pirellulales bacterium]|nr:hypothetical protein [Pirellulales bacterium]
MFRPAWMLSLVLTAGAAATLWPQTAAAQVFSYYRPGRRSVTILGGPLGPAPLDPYSVSAYWGFWPSPLVARQSIGHQIIWTGPNGYVYRPVYPDDGPSGITQTDGFKILPRSATAPGFAERIAERFAGAAPGVAPAPPLPAAAAAKGPFEAALALFRGGRYEQSLDALEQAPEAEGAAADLLAAQALFALADYPAAVEALDRATDRLPADQWGRYVANYRDYFPSPLRYVVHLRSLERFTEQFPDRAEARILLAYQYGSLGFSDRAIALLDEIKADPLARRLREHFIRQQTAPAPAPEPGDEIRGPLLVAPGPPAKQAPPADRPGPREF